MAEGLVGGGEVLPVDLKSALELVNSAGLNCPGDAKSPFPSLAAEQAGLALWKLLTNQNFSPHVATSDWLKPCVIFGLF